MITFCCFVFFCNHIRASWKVPEEAAAFESRWESGPRSGPKGATGPRRTGSVTGQEQVNQSVKEHSRVREDGEHEGPVSGKEVW